ncbi:MAG: hypothetical protein RBT41_02380 [Clostridia bacterium]|nr:hypothetical protein [Clostridia bacterium]
MPQIPLLAWIFQTIPECIATASLAMSIATNEFYWNKIWKIGLAQAIITYLIRLLPFTPGVHVIILAATLGVLCIHIGKIEMKRALTFSAITMAVLVLAEFVSVYSLMSLGLTNFEEMSQNIYLRIIYGCPHIIIVFLIALLFVKKKLNLTFLFRKSDNYYFTEREIDE